MLNNQPSSPIRVTALLPAKFAGTSFMTYLKKYDIKVVTMIENMDEVSRMPLFKDWMYMGDLKRMVNGVLYNCKGGPFNPYCQDLYKIPDFRFTYMAFYWREIIGFHSTYKLDPHFYLSPSVIAQQVHELIVECNARFAACEAILISQIKNETPATSSLFADAMGTPPTHIDWENYIFGIKAPNQKAIVQSLKYEEIAQIVEQKMKSVKRGFFQMLANGAARSMLSFFSR
ncbi:hypothetical protein HMI55_000923 [Coelomomyces lativittatus]|nr:hypothetical protein HMI55_000923 [Coelomomyces lativittatus]